MDAGKEEREGEKHDNAIYNDNIIYTVRSTGAEGLHLLFADYFPPSPPLTIRNSFKLCQLLGEGGQLGLV